MRLSSLALATLLMMAACPFVPTASAQAPAAQSSADQATTGQTTAGQATTDQATTDQTATGQANDQSMPAPPTAPVNPPMTGPQLLIATAMGDITLQLDSVRAPRSVANILSYVHEGHYNGTVVYRVVKGFVIQMGSWEANKKGRGVHVGTVPFEANNGLSNLRGTVALAHGPDLNASADFFINLADNAALDHKPDDAGNTTGYAVFGQVVGGMDVVDAIAQVPVGDNGPMPGQAPVDPILIKKISVVGEPDRPAVHKRRK